MTTIVAPAVRAGRAVLRGWRYLYGANPLHLLVMIGCFALVGYVVLMVYPDPSAIALAIWFGGAVLGHDLVLYPLYALADQPLIISRGARRKVAPRPVVPVINHIRVPVLGSALLGLIFFPSITGRGDEAFEFTAALPVFGQFDNWLLITGVLFLGSGVTYALRLGVAGGRGIVGLVRRRSAARSPTTAEDVTTPAVATAATSVSDPSADATEAFPAPDADPTEVFATPEVEAALHNDESALADETVTDVVSGDPETVPDADGGGAEAGGVEPETGSGGRPSTTRPRP